MCLNDPAFPSLLFQSDLTQRLSHPSVAWDFYALSVINEKLGLFYLKLEYPCSTKCCPGNDISSHILEPFLCLEKGGVESTPPLLEGCSWPGEEKEIERGEER
eukprot:TRINITY_DN753_c0_g1_i3.p1 TRINITY_DN753_c0_g1~~TRINITY_DN753_c0_g1_i3.p1  ORF type:complete len:103 (+),score=19.22 TRINITY_DN753_c0_g1_i3:1895-2203(+)